MARIDVLAVITKADSSLSTLFDYAERRSRKHWCEDADVALAFADPWPDLRQALTAVAELLSAARTACVYMEAKDLNAGFLRDAIANCGGAA